MQSKVKIFFGSLRNFCHILLIWNLLYTNIIVNFFRQFDLGYVVTVWKKDNFEYCVFNPLSLCKYSFKP